MVDAKHSESLREEGIKAANSICMYDIISVLLRTFKGEFSDVTLARSLCLHRVGFLKYISLN